MVAIEERELRSRPRGRAYNDGHQQDGGEIPEKLAVVERVGSLQYDPGAVGGIKLCAVYMHYIRRPLKEGQITKNNGRFKGSLTFYP